MNGGISCLTLEENIGILGNMHIVFHAKSENVCMVNMKLPPGVN